VNKKSPAYILLFMAAICIVCGIGVSIVNYATQGLLEKNAALHRNRVLCHAFQLKVDGTSAEAYQQAVDANLVASQIKDGATTRQMYTQITPGKQSLGFEFSGMGFWDRITGILVVTPDHWEVLNIQFLEQKETPGLGARIEEPWFTDQFKGLIIGWNSPEGHFIVVGAETNPDARNRVDAITGATQTSMALMQFLNAELARIRTLEINR
jgi:Na+-transporting NADH:ubiquinone oxidoreductase subunit C